MSELVDIQNKKDIRKIDIDKVGVSNLKYPVVVKDRENEIQHTIATVSLSVDLPHHFKGTHMSRFVQVLNSHGRELTVNDMDSLPEELLKRLNAQRAHVEYRFPYFRQKKAPVTQMPALIDAEAIFSIEAEKNSKEHDFTVTVVAPVTTLCPCSKAISARGAHNQRGQVTFSIKFRKPIWIEDLLEMVEKSASAELFSLLKRPDEKFVTEHAYDNPVFVEDLVRNVAERAIAHKDIKWFRVEAENYESIHNHNAFALIEKNNCSSK